MEPLEGNTFGHCVLCTSADKLSTLHFLSSQQLEASKLLFQHHIKTQEALKFIQTPSSCWKKTRGRGRQAMNCLKDPSDNKYLRSGPLFTSWNVSSCSKSIPDRNTKSYINFIWEAATHHRLPDKWSKTLRLRPQPAPLPSALYRVRNRSQLSSGRVAQEIGASSLTPKRFWVSFLVRAQYLGCGFNSWSGCI